jgi:hypothetical protein
MSYICVGGNNAGRIIPFLVTEVQLPYYEPEVVREPMDSVIMPLQKANTEVYTKRCFYCNGGGNFVAFYALDVLSDREALEALLRIYQVHYSKPTNPNMEEQ